MPRIDLDILNQKQTPAFYASSLATRPAASFVGRIFIDSDNPSTGLYRDTGTAWVQIADPGAGTTGTLQQVTTNGSTTNVGISVTTNGIGIGTAIPGANILDVHGTTGVLAQLENTTTQNSLLSFRNQGAGAWSVGNGYNAGANDFIIYDAVSFINRFTIKSTGQTFVGSDTTSSGKLVVNSSTSDSHIVVLGANGPSVRLRDTGTAPTLNVGLGISTAANNFIQGSVSGDYCIFNASTTASPILFGVYDSGSGNTIEGARLSAARNFLLGTVTDPGFKLSVSGTSNFTAALRVTNANIDLSNSYQLTGRNAANTAYIGIISRNTSDQISIDGAGYGTIFGGSVGIGTTTPNSILQVSGTGLVKIDSSAYLQTPASTGLSIGWNRSGGNGETSLIWGSPASSYVFEICSYASSTITTRFSIDTTGLVTIVNTPVYATNALALAGGLVVGQIYKSATGVLSIVY